MSRRAGALACFARGLGLSLTRPYLALSVWLIQLLLASVVILPMSNTLHAELDHAPMADRMVANPDFGWWETFRRTHPDVLGTFPDLAANLLSAEGAKKEDVPGLRGVGAMALSLALLGVIAHAFALGGILGALREPSASLVIFCREGMRRFPAFLAFTLSALLAALADGGAHRVGREARIERGPVVEMHRGDDDEVRFATQCLLDPADFRRAEAGRLGDERQVFGLIAALELGEPGGAALRTSEHGEQRGHRAASSRSCSPARSRAMASVDR